MQLEWEHSVPVRECKFVCGRNFVIMQQGWYYSCKKNSGEYWATLCFRRTVCCAHTCTHMHLRTQTHSLIPQLWIIDTEVMCQSPWSGLEPESRLNVHQPWPQPDRVTHPHTIRHTQSHARSLLSWQHSPSDQWDMQQLPQLRRAASWQNMNLSHFYASLKLRSFTQELSWCRWFISEGSSVC